MYEIYTDKKYIKDTVTTLEDSIKELQMVSVYNDDLLDEEAVSLIRNLILIKEKLKIL